MNCVCFVCCINATSMSDHWKVAFDFYINDMKMVVVAIWFWYTQLWVIQPPNNQNTLTVQSLIKENYEVHFHHHHHASMLESLFYQDYSCHYYYMWFNAESGTDPDILQTRSDPLDPEKIWPGWPDPVSTLSHIS